MQNNSITPSFENTPFLNDLSNEFSTINQFGIIRKDDVLKLAKSLIIKPTDEIQPPIVAIKINDGILGTLGNFSMIIGKAKSRKSFFLNLLTTSLIKENETDNIFSCELPNDQKNVLFFDTEQGNYHVQLALHRICKLSENENPTNLIVVGLRSKTPQERLEIIEQMIYDTPNLGYVFIDGIKDLITSINDEDQATMISSKLLKWTEDVKIHITVVLHQNKSDNNARGHIGTELLNKAETVLSVNRIESDKDVSIVQPEQCRNREPQPFAFEIIDGLPIICEEYQFKSESKAIRLDMSKMPIEDIGNVLHHVFSQQQEFSYSYLAKEIKNSYYAIFKKDIGDNKIKYFIKECRRQNYLLQPKPKGKYSINTKYQFINNSNL